MERPFRRILAFAAAACLLSAGSSSAGAPSAIEALAREALDQALSMPAGEPREKVLLAVSRELRRRHRDVAIEAARAMRAPHELESFAPGPDTLATEIRGTMAEAGAEIARCEALSPRGLTPTQLEEEVQTCFLFRIGHCDFGCPRLPADDAIALAGGLRVGEARRDLLLLALAQSWDDADSEPARRVLAEVRALKPLLPRGMRGEIDRMLANPYADLLDGAPERALARLRRGAENGGEITGLVELLIRRGALDDAVAAWALLAEREGCIDPEFLYSLTWPREEAGEAAALQGAFIDRLPAGGAGPCPGGVGPELRARLEIGAERLPRALAAAERIADPYVADDVRLSAARLYLRRYMDEAARPILIAMADRLTPLVRPSGDEIGRLYRAAENRAVLVMALAWVGETERAVRVARSFDVPGWRAWSLALVAGNVPGPGGTGPREVALQISGNDVPPLP